MQVREAKDFLVAQTAEQAALEGVPLSDLEKRMMYFTESPDAVEDPIKLNEKFEAQYDSNAYEKKMSVLLAHAYLRLKRGNSQAVAEWDAAVDKLYEGDHYLLVLWGATPTARAPFRTYLRLLTRVVMLASITLVLGLGLKYLLKPLGISFASFLFFSFAAIVIAVALKPQSLGAYLKRMAMKIVVFLIGRRKSNG